MTSTCDGGVTATAASFVERLLRPARDAGVCDARVHGRLDQLILVFGLDIRTRIFGALGACGIVIGRLCTWDPKFRRRFG